MTAVSTAAIVVGPDPRPVVVLEAGDGTAILTGARCDSCGYPVAEDLERCPICRGSCSPTSFGPDATVFAATVLRVPVPGRTPPYGLAYIDLDDGPRILAHTDVTDAALVPGSRVRLIGTTAEGDPCVTIATPDATDEEHP